MFSPRKTGYFNKLSNRDVDYPETITHFVGDNWLSQSLYRNSFREDIDFLKEKGLLQLIAPELFVLDDIPAGPQEYHKEGSALEHTIRVVEESEAMAVKYELKETERFILKLGAVVHDLGKGVPKYKQLPSHPKHTVRGKSIAKRFSRRLGFPPNLVKFCGHIARFHMRFTDLTDLREKTLLNTISALDSTIEDSAIIGPYLAEADSLGRVPSLQTNLQKNLEMVTTTRQTLEEITIPFVEDKFEVQAAEESEEYINGLLTQERVLHLRDSLAV